MNFKKLFKTHKLLGKTTVSKTNPQEKSSIGKLFLVKALHKLKYIIAFLVLFFGNPFDDFNANYRKTNGSEKIELQIENDSIFYFELTKTVDRDTTLILNFHKEN